MWWKLGIAFVGGAVIGGISTAAYDHHEFNKVLEEIEGQMVAMLGKLAVLKTQAEMLEKKVEE